MPADADIFDRPRGALTDGLFGRAAAMDAQKEEGGEQSCPAFGYLRGLHDRAVGVEFRFRAGHREWHAYGHLGTWRFDPSVGLLLKFTGDLVSLVLVRGSNLDALVHGAVNLTDRGLARHRVTWVREMDEDELQRAGPGPQPTIDRIEIAEFEDQGELRDWLKRAAPAFLRG